MKKEYSRYEQGALIKVEKKLSLKDKETLDNFLKKSSITAAPKKVQHIRRLILQLVDVTQLPLTKQTKESVDSFLVLLSNCDKSYWTKDEIKVYVKQFLLWYYKDLEMVENFHAESKKGLNPKINENNLITEQEVEQMLRFAESYKEKAYLLLAFQTGARPQELIDLKWKDIKFEDKYADVTLFSTKTETSRTFPVVEKTMKALWEWKEHYYYPDVSQKDYVFPSRWRDKPITTAGLNKMLRRMAKSAGIKKDVWGYLFRHSRATRLYEELPQQIVEKLMGHKNMAGVYAHISSKKAREEMLSKIYKIENFPEEKKHELENRVLELEKEIKFLNKALEEEMMGEESSKEKSEPLNLNKKEMKKLAQQVAEIIASPLKIMSSKK
jgi:integrase